MCSVLTLSLHDQDERPAGRRPLSHLNPSSTINQAELIEALIHFIVLEPNRRLKGQRWRSSLHRRAAPTA